MINARCEFLRPMLKLDGEAKGATAATTRAAKAHGGATKPRTRTVAAAAR